MILVRSLIYVVWLYVGMILAALLCAPYAAFSRKGSLLAMRLWAPAAFFGLRWICGIRVRIEGREHIPPGPSIVAMKHQAMFDTIIPAVVLPDPCIVFKVQLRAVPLFGWYLDRGEMIPVARETHASALKEMLRAARAAVAQGRQIFIFPEGTRKWPGEAPDYKPGVAAIYRDLNVPCVPAATNSGSFWPPHGIIRKPGEIVVKFLPPIPPGLSRHDFMNELQTRIETESAALLPEVQRRAA
jgi:1-acyl-sn-glycerol-3-phosphate acyltransferase